MLFQCKKTTYLDTYAYYIKPCDGPLLWPANENESLNPPEMRRALGRPKKFRNKANDELRNNYTLPRKENRGGPVEMLEEEDTCEGA